MQGQYIPFNFSNYILEQLEKYRDNKNNGYSCEDLLKDVLRMNIEWFNKHYLVNQSQPNVYFNQVHKVLPFFSRKIRIEKNLTKRQYTAHFKSHLV